MATTVTKNHSVDFMDKDQNKNVMKMEDLDPDFIKQESCHIVLKEEIQGPGFTEQHECGIVMKEEDLEINCMDQDHNNSGIKEENQDPDFIEQNQIKVEVKEEDQESDLMNQDHHSTSIKEENQDPDQSFDPAGSTHHQIQAVEVKNQNQDLEFAKQHQYKTEIKEENQDLDQSIDSAGSINHQAVEVTKQNQDPEFAKQHQNKTEIKEENQESDLMDQDHLDTSIKEEIQDLDQQSTKPSGSTDHQLFAESCATMCAADQVSSTVHGKVDQSQPEISPLVIRSAQALHELLGSKLSVAPTASQRTGQSAGQSMAVGSGQSTVSSAPTVRQALKRLFPHIFSKSADQPRGKRRFSAPATSVVKTTNFHVYVLPGPTKFTPRGSAEELQLATAGLGKRMISLAENWGHSQIEAQLWDEFPKLKTLKGGWMFYKSTGGSGRRKMKPILQGPEGYTFETLKGASSSGKNTLFLVPLQEQLSIEPLPYDSPEFSNMPKANCMKCGILLPLQLLPLHLEGCKDVDEFEASPDEDNTVIEEPVLCTTALSEPPTTEIGESTKMGDSSAKEESCEVCPICQVAYSIDALPFHASMCSEGMDIADTTSREAASLTSVEELPGPSFRRLSTPPSAAWEQEKDPKEACKLFRQQLLERNSKCPHLLLSINMSDPEEEKDSSFIEFYKRNNVNWAAPFKCTLTGDAAIGEGVKRHVLSMAMQKLKTGFSINLGSASLTPLFEGEKDHQVPSAAGVLRECKLFEMAGRILGHNFIHGGPGFPGLSLAVVTLLTGRDTETAVAALTLEDVADLDHRETIGLLKKAELTVQETTRVTDLCLSWYQPTPNSTNHDWLLQLLLSKAVLHHGMQPIKQIRKGLKETGIWPLLSARPDVHPILFPRESSVEICSQTTIESIRWPQPTCDSDEEEDDPIPLDQ